MPKQPKRNIGRLDWRIYYDGADPVDSGQVGPDGVPVFGVLVIVCRDSDHGRRLVATKDFYVWVEWGDEYSWLGVDQYGLLDYLAQPGWKKILIGRMVHPDRFNEAMRRADQDPDFPSRSGFHPHEPQLEGPNK